MNQQELVNKIAHMSSEEYEAWTKQEEGFFVFRMPLNDFFLGGSYKAEVGPEAKRVELDKDGNFPEVDIPDIKVPDKTAMLTPQFLLKNGFCLDENDFRLKDGQVMFRFVNEHVYLIFGEMHRKVIAVFYHGVKSWIAMKLYSSLRFNTRESIEEIFNA